MKKALLIFLGVGLLSVTCAQQTYLSVIAPAGNADQVNGVVMEWTMGEMAIMSLETFEGYMTQGFHQPLLSVQAMKVPQLVTEQKVTMNVRPNPVTTRITISLETKSSGSAFLYLSDMKGMMLKTEKVNLETGDLEWDMTELSAGIYLLSLRSEKGELLKSFKIVKNH
ncbi:MAG: T9SS C-terminal target domain-containing protein [Bacteroidetes bacterium]|nr:MAG: T9SS C-terminal target domain-containing protein [Bacteroidota bacterium]